MARKKIREYDGKRMLAQFFNIPLLAILVAAETNLQQLPTKYSWLSSTKLVVKPDVLAGKRGKSNLVLLNKSFEEAVQFLNDNMNKECEINGVKGNLTHFLIEPFIPHKEEYYLSISTTREDTVINFSLVGGINVEENWDKVKSLKVPVGDSIDQVKLEELLFEGTSTEVVSQEQRSKVSTFIRKVFKFFEAYDFGFLEMNPFVVDSSNNELVALDFVGEVDSTAHFKNTKKWGELEFPEPFGKQKTPEEKYVQEMDEKTGASLKLTILNPNGRIWNLVAGGGASVIFADTVADLGYGSELGNYGEYSGAPNEEETYHYAKTLLDLATRNPDSKRRALLIGGGIANFTDVAKTFKGIIHAIKEYSDKIKAANMKIFVRRAGPNYKTGLKLMRKVGDELGIPIEVYGPEETMTKIVPLAVQYIQS